MRRNKQDRQLAFTFTSSPLTTGAPDNDGLFQHIPTVFYIDVLTACTLYLCMLTYGVVIKSCHYVNSIDKSTRKLTVITDRIEH